MHWICTWVIWKINPVSERQVVQAAVVVPAKIDNTIVPVRLVVADGNTCRIEFGTQDIEPVTQVLHSFIY